MCRKLQWSWLVVAVLANAGWAQAPAEDKPYLVLNAGGHTAIIRNVLFGAGGKEVITVSDDKTIRIWDAATGEPLRVLRPPIGAGRYGMLAGAALHPQGKLLAVGGHDDRVSYPIYLIDLNDGRIKKVLRGHDGRIRCLAFSAQGDRLASGGTDSVARIWDVATGQCVRVLKGHTKSVGGVAFAPDGARLATASFDQTARIWDLAAGKSAAVLQGHDNDVLAVAWSRDGKRLATGGRDQAVRLWDARGKLVNTFGQLKGAVTALRFLARDQEILFAAFATGARGSVARSACLELSNKGKAGSGTVRVEMRHAKLVHDADVDPTERWAVSTGGNDETLVWDLKNGKEVSRLVGRGNTPLAAAWGPDGAHIAWGNKRSGNSRAGTTPLERTFALDVLEFGPAPTDKFGGRRLVLGDVSIRFEGAKTIQVSRGGPKPSTAQFTAPEPIYCGTLLTSRLAAIGYSGLQLLDLDDGKWVRNFVGHAGSVNAVAASRDGRYLLSGGNDQTLRIWPTEGGAIGGIGIQVKASDDKLLITSVTQKAPADGVLRIGDQIVAIEKAGAFVAVRSRAEMSPLLRGPVGASVKVRVRPKDRTESVDHTLVRKEIGASVEPLLSLFFAGNGSGPATEWVAWTPEGYYAASPGGERLMGWHVNNGPDKMASFYPAALFRQSLYRPDLIKILLQAGSVDKALAVADLARGKKSSAIEVADVLPPLIVITAPDRARVETTEARMAVRFLAQPVGKHPITAVRLMLDGRPYPGAQHVKKFDPPRTVAVRDAWTVQLDPGTHTLAVQVESPVSKAVSEPVEVVVTKARGAELEPDEKEKKLELPNLYILAVGVSQYPQNTMKLKYAAKDATVLVKTFQATSHSLYRTIEVKVLTDKDATRRNILQGLTWLRKQMTQRDVAIVSFAGHGSQDADGKFYLLPVDVDKDDLLSTAVPGEQIKSVLGGIPGRVIVLLDACHSGGVDGAKRRAAGSLTDDLVRDLVTDDYGVVVMCSSMGREFSLESATVEHGYFTLALIEGLSGKADYAKEGLVYLNGLDLYVTTRVKELSQGKQHPVTTRPTSIRSFPLSRPGASRSADGTPAQPR